MRLDVTLARIRAIVGEENAGCAVLKDTHKPDQLSMKPFTITSTFAAKETPIATRAAARQLRPPESSSVTLQDARPRTFTFRNKRYTVEHAYGPWLGSGDWWNAERWGMEQWDLIARSQDGTVLFCCLIREPARNHWQVVALYD
jgi:protein ImuB